MRWESSGKLGRVHWGINKKFGTTRAKYIPFFLPFSEKIGPLISLAIVLEINPWE